MGKDGSSRRPFRCSSIGAIELGDGNIPGRLRHGRNLASKHSAADTSDTSSKPPPIPDASSRKPTAGPAYAAEFLNVVTDRHKVDCLCASGRPLAGSTIKSWYRAIGPSLLQPQRMGAIASTTGLAVAQLICRPISMSAVFRWQPPQNPTRCSSARLNVRLATRCTQGPYLQHVDRTVRHVHKDGKCYCTYKIGGEQ